MKAILTVTQPSNSIPSNQREIQTFPALDPTFLMISLTILSAIAIPIYACIPKRKQYSVNSKPPPNITCVHCQYFNNNHYLKCALHPVTVLTEQASDCNDYGPSSRAKQVEELKKIVPFLQSLVWRSVRNFFS